MSVQETTLSDMEELAAYIDGRLDGERKAAVEERLLRDEDYYEVFTETVRYQQEETPLAADAVPLPSRQWRRSLVALPLAAAALLTVVIGVWRSSPPALDAATAVALGKEWDNPGWSVQRSAGLQDQYLYNSREQIAFRLGVRLVDLPIAVRGGDRLRAESHAAQLAELADALGSITLNVEFERLGDAIQNSIGSEEFEDRVALLENRVAAFLKDSPEVARYIEFGSWAETGRLAALTENDQLLHRLQENAQTIRELDEVAPLVERLDGLLESLDGVDGTHLDVAVVFVKIIEELAG